MFDPIQNTLEEMHITDMVFSKMRDHDAVEVDSNIVIINNGHLNRAEIANLVNIVNYHEPKVIGIDAMFRKPKGDELDIPLAEAFSEVENLVLVCGLAKPNQDDSFDTVQYSLPMFNQYADNGYANLYIPSDDFRTVRLAQANQFVKGKEILSFPVKVASFYDSDKTYKFLQRDNDFEVINYKRNIDKYITYDYSELERDPEAFDILKDKIVLIGYLGPNLEDPVTEDIFFTPMNENYVGKTQADMYGIVIHANTISMILEQDFIARTPEWISYMLVYLVVILNMVSFDYFRRKYPNFYQPYTVLLILGELIGFTTLIIVLLHNFSIELKFAGAFFSLIVCVLAFELYTDSLKPLVVSRYRSYVFERDRKRAKEINKRLDDNPLDDKESK